MTKGEAVAKLEASTSALRPSPSTFVAGEDVVLLRRDAARRRARLEGRRSGSRQLGRRVRPAARLPPPPCAVLRRGRPTDDSRSRTPRSSTRSTRSRRMRIATPRSAALVRRGLRFRVVPEQSGMPLDAGCRGASSSSGRWAARAHTAARSCCRRGRGATRDRRDARGAGRARAHRRLGSGLPRSVRAELAALASADREPARAFRGTARAARDRGAAADAYFRGLAERVGTSARDAGFEASGEVVQVVPARAGLELNVPKTASAMLRAATRPANRVATVSVVRALPDRSTAEAHALGIDTRMASYKTYNAGTWDRITNLRLGVTLLDGTLVAPGGTFSLNDTIGERTEERGFRSAPVIIGTEYDEEVGGGTSQVATTVFNAAWEAGVRITRAEPAQPLHQPLPARSRRDRLLAVARPEVPERHDEVDAREGLRRGRRDPRRIYGGERGASRALRRRSRSRARHRSSGSRTRRSRGARPVVEAEGLVAEQDLRDADDLRRERGAHARRRRGTRRTRARTRVVHVGTKVEPKPKPPPKTPPWTERRRACRRRRDDYAAGASALATASASQSGTRIGRYVSRSTVAWLVWPSATSSPSRSIRYSYGSARRGGPCTAPTPSASRRSTRRGGTSRRPRSSAPRCRGRGSPGSRRRAARGTRRGRPRGRRRRTRGARCPARPSPRSGRGPRSRTRSRPRAQA